jgi:hypothetical protein
MGGTASRSSTSKAPAFRAKQKRVDLKCRSLIVQKRDDSPLIERLALVDVGIVAGVRHETVFFENPFQRFPPELGGVRL